MIFIFFLFPLKLFHLFLPQLACWQQPSRYQKMLNGLLNDLRKE